MKSYWLAVCMAVGVLAGCGGGSGGDGTQAPTALTYSSNPAVYSVGSGITDNTPSSSGGAVTAYSVSPSLPAGLTLDIGTGVISGTPTAATASTSYTVTATNSGGSTTASVSITVNDIAPVSLSYGSNPAVYSVGSGITDNAPSSSGGAVTAYSVSPSLPAGLALDTGTGVISGTPTASIATASYTVTATNSGGSTTASVSITVNDIAPVSLSYGSNPAVYSKGTAIGDNAPGNEGGSVVAYSVSPDLPAGLSLDTDTGVISGTPTETVIARYTVTASNSGGSTSSELAITVEGFDDTTGSMTTNRKYATATRLADGKVLITGGYGDSGTLSSAELYDPATETFTATSGAMNVARYSAMSALLPDGRVLIAGGYDGSSGVLTSAELYDPSTDSFTATSGTMNVARFDATAILLANGKVLIAAGSGASGALSSAELYDPASDSFSATSGALTAARQYAMATLLANGKVLIAGGFNSSSGYLSSAELYDPSSDSFSATGGTMSTVRQWATATLLPNGKVLIAAGSNGSNALSSAELYDPASDSFTPTSGSLSVARYRAMATRLPNGLVLITGGYGSSTVLSSATLYDPSTDSFTSTVSMSEAREYASATLLSNGQVLIVGGVDGSANTLSSAERYQPVYPNSESFAATGEAMTTIRVNATATLLPSGQVLIAGGYFSSAELYDPSTESFTATSETMSAARHNATATLLPNGQVLIAGGYNASSGFLASAELYDPATESFMATGGSMSTGRMIATATLLPSGKVLIAGGAFGASALSSAELYDPATDSFTATSGPMSTGRGAAMATLLPNGKVLIAGGKNLFNFLSSPELYDPATDSFTATSGGMTTVRANATATLLPNGKVLIAGGGDGSSVLLSAELYDPATETFTATSGSMTVAREYASATLLSNGKVLIAGGEDSSGYLSSAELYDPSTDSFTAISDSMSVARDAATATLLPNGKVLIAGGVTTGLTYLSSAELYDPWTESFTATVGAMTTATTLGTAILLPNGEVLLVGGYDGSGALSSAELYQPAKAAHGMLDTSFNGVGYNTLDGGVVSHDLGESVVIAADGSFYIAGSVRNVTGTGYDMALWHLLADGTADTGFDGDGLVLLAGPAGGTGHDFGKGIAIDSNGKIVVAGHSLNASGDTDIFVARFNTDGSLDTTFGGDVNPADATPDGFVVVDTSGFGSSDEGNAVVLDSSDNIYVAGTTNAAGDNDMAVWKVTSAGVLDTTFAGGAGYLSYDSGGADAAYGIAIDGDGKLLVTGSAGSMMAIWRITASGVSDTTFNGTGIVADSSGTGRAVTIDADGNIVVTGSKFVTSTDMALWRYTSAGVPDTTFGNHGGYVTHDGAGLNASGVSESGYAVAIDAEGNILVAGTAPTTHDSSPVRADMAVWRFTPAGVLDVTFGDDVNPADIIPDGFTTHNGAAGGNDTDEGKAIAIDSLGRAVVVGNSLNADSNADMAIWRLY